jgi:4-amino-4-deoxy-L-arabinose transferase-like glycosyltransferase
MSQPVMDVIAEKHAPRSRETRLSDADKLKLLRWVVLIFIFALAAYFRFVNLRANPGWYTDEGEFIEYARNLANGHWEAFGLVNSPMLIQRPPLFLYVLALLFKIFGTDILVLRTLSAVYGMLTMFFVYFFTREAFSEKLALITAGLMAIWPWIVAYNRMGFTYNQVAFFLALSIYAGWKFSVQKRPFWGILACLASSLCLATDYLGAIAPLLVVSIFVLYRRRWVLPGTLLIFTIIALILISPFISSSQNFFSDFTTTMQARTSTSPIEQLINIIVDYGELIRRETWVIIGLIGLFFLPGGRARGMIWFVVGTSLLVILRSLVPVGVGLHYLLHLFPWIVLGIAAFFERAVSQIYSYAYSFFDHLKSFFPEINRFPKIGNIWSPAVKIATNLTLFFLLIIPILWMGFANMAQSVQGAYFMFTYENDLDLSVAKDVDRVSSYLEQHMDQDQLVAASAQILWALPGKKAYFPFMLTYEGVKASSLSSISKDRFAYPYAFDHFSYVVLDPLLTGFSLRIYPDLVSTIKTVRQWPLVYESGDLQVYRNPQVQSGSIK